MITTLCISGYRSLRDIRIELEALNIVTGPNGAGKSSLYRALRLLADIAHGGIIRALAMEGGVQSALWAGPTRNRAVSLKLGFATEDYGYAIDLGYPIPSDISKFNYDPQIKMESLWLGQVLHPRNEIAKRHAPLVQLRNQQHEWDVVLDSLAPYDSMMTHASDPQNARELLILREAMRCWRFYDHFRTDTYADVRRPQIGTRTPVLASDGRDLAAAIQTIREIGMTEDFQKTLDDAFPGADIHIIEESGYFEVFMTQPGLYRPMRAAELSDGTLRYLLLIAALLSPRPPELMVLNEPEMSLHPDLLPALGRLIATASKRSQTVVVTHAPELAEAIAAAAPAKRIVLSKGAGETRIENEDDPSWHWPSR